MRVRVEAFTYRYGTKIPKKYTCEGEEISPGIKWDEVPEGTKTFALVMEDMDVPNRSTPYILWLVFNIPGELREIWTGVLPEEAQVGMNDEGKVGYGAPCPVPGPDHHRYAIHLYALDAVLDLKDGADIKEFNRASKGHILAHVEALGTYEIHKNRGV